VTKDTPLERLRRLAVPEGAVGLSWLGQAGFVLRANGATALLDPFLAPYEGRVYESGLAPAQAEGIDAVLCTHEHVDHFDADSAPAIAAASPGAVFVVPTPIVDMVTEAGIAPDRVVGLQPGERVELAGLGIRAVPAMHGVTMEDAYGFGESLSGGLVRFLGYVVDAEAVRLYHAGDTIHYGGMETALRDLAIDVAMLPINGRDPEREARGIVGNLSEREAAWLAKEIDAGVVLPMHYDLFARNRGYPAHLVESVERDHPGTSVFVPTRDEPFVWSSGRPR
jgi:L-ascorbate metabolism protein UlaG (beta-lactamase superfamily)